ncbi:MAG: Uma2 family endonuclease [Planctomycetes bacterium]|nr:Uma2 family endonuclease [Planctomycetota bacterium]
MVQDMIEQALATGVRLAPLDVDQYHRMLEGGILLEGAPIELLDGVLVYKDRSAIGGEPMTVGPSQAQGVKRLQRIATRVDPLGCHLYCQAPITLAPRHEPEPDGVIARGTADDYSDRHPGPGDVLVVFEVADSSLSTDRTVKSRIYADAGIPSHVLVDLPDRRVELYEAPLPGQGRYDQVASFTPGQKFVVQLVEGRTVELTAAELLP